MTTSAAEPRGGTSHRPRSNDGESFLGEQADGKYVESGAIRTERYDNGDVYEGEMKDGKRYGKGVCRFVSGNVYDGDWKDDLKDGIGTFTWADGDRYEEQQFVEGKRHGRGEMTWADGNAYEGDVYAGEFKEGKRHGRIYKWTDGAVYDGSWVADKPHGKGTKTWPTGNVYEGQWVDGDIQGSGKYGWAATGNVYEGEWAKNKQHGRGILKEASGDVYEGSFSEGKRHGEGSMKYGNGDEYKGQWAGGNPNGTGTKTWVVGDVYQGQWVDGDMHGTGEYIWAATGNVYEGEWAKNNQHGRGTLKEVSGDVYEGQWKEGKRHGEGTLKYSSGGMYEGIWTDGKKTQGKMRWGKYALSGKEKRKVYDERQLRSQQSQQRRHHTAKKTCEHCGANDYHYKLRVCSGCGVALYCSAACQKAASGSHRRICDIMSELPNWDADRLALKYNKDRMVDLDAGVRYATKYMSNLKHLEINVKDKERNDTIKLSATKLSSLLRSKKGALDTFFWVQKASTDIPGISQNGDEVWKELHDLRQLRVCHLKFDDVQCVHDIIYQQRNTLMVLELSYLNIDWHRAKYRRTFAQAVSACKHLVKLDLNGCLLMDSDLKVMLNGLPNLRILHLKRCKKDSHEFTDKTCGLIARKCPELQELNLAFHDHLSVRGIRKIFEGCPHLRVFLTTICKLNCEDVHNLLDIAPQLMYLSLNKEVGIAERELDAIIEATGGRTLIQFNDGGNHYVYSPGEILSAETRAKHQQQKQLGIAANGKSLDPEVANEWEGLFEKSGS